MAKVIVDRVKCVSLGVCESLAPAIFEVTDAGELELLTDGDIDDENLEAVRAAVAGCPTEALTLVED